MTLCCCSAFLKAQEMGYNDWERWYTLAYGYNKVSLEVTFI